MKFFIKSFFYLLKREFPVELSAEEIFLCSELNRLLVFGADKKVAHRISLCAPKNHFKIAAKYMSFE